jgi:hypothetical protein
LKKFLYLSSNESYEKGNGWIDILKPLTTLEYKNRAELYTLFANIRNRYIPQYEIFE